MQLTDDDLTRELGEAFRTATTDLTYRGRTRPPRRVPVALPVAAVAATMAVVAVGAVHATDNHHPVGARTAIAPANRRPTGVHPSVARTHRLVTKTLTLAGFTITFQHAAGAPDPVFAELDVASLPAGASPVALSGTEAKAWVGTDPQTGDNAVYVKVPTRNGGRLFAVLSATWSQDQLVDLLKAPNPTPVPAVSATS
jgi:hypothetical protein